MKLSALIAAAAMAALTVTAGAADMQRPVYKAQPIYSAGYDWGGFYAGVNAGWGQNRELTSITGTDPIARTIIDIGLIPSTMDPAQAGAVIGGQAGWRQQLGAFVWGVDAEFNWSNIKGDQSQVLTLSPIGLPASLTTTTSTELNWYGTAAVTFGFAFDRVLVYGKTGFAYGDVDHTVSSTLSTPIPGLNATARADFGGTEVGWVVGGGIEAALVGGWTIGAEYTYVDLGDSSADYSTKVLGTNVAFTADRDNTFHTVKGRLNYRF